MVWAYISEGDTVYINKILSIVTEWQVQDIDQAMNSLTHPTLFP